MTQIFDEQGQVTPITIIEAGPCFVAQIKKTNRDGYTAVQLGFAETKPKRLTNAQLEHLKKSNLPPLRHLREFRMDEEEIAPLQEGQKITVDIFQVGELVDVTGISKGKGFAGVMKRHGFKGMPASRGCERKHRHPGGIGSNSGSAGTARAIRKGKKMGGHMGHVRCTSCNRRVVDIDVGNNLLMVKGPVPGPANGFVMIRTAKTRQ